MSNILECSGYDMVNKEIVRAQDCYLFDSKGRMFVDFEAGVWCTILGHNHPRVNLAMTAQLQRIAHVGYRYSHQIVEDAAVSVLETVNLAEGKCIFLSSGSEAVEFAVQIARRLLKRPLLITLSNSYLAAYGSAGKRNSEEWYCFDWSQCNNCSYSECDVQCPLFKQIPFNRIGGMVFEPGNSSGLVKLPPSKLVRALESMVRQTDGMIVIDEVTTGFGRTGAWYGFQHYSLKPDIIAIGKGLGNGYPVSVTVMTNEVACRLEKENFRYAQSHQNDPLGCAVAREVCMTIRDEGLIDRGKTVGDMFLAELVQLGRKFKDIKEVRGKGLMLAVEFKSNDADFSLEAVYNKLLEKGFMVGYKPAANILRFYPALTINEIDIKRLTGMLERVLQKNSNHLTHS